MRPIFGLYRNHSSSQQINPIPPATKIPLEPLMELAGNNVLIS